MFEDSNIIQSNIIYQTLKYNVQRADLLYLMKKKSFDAKFVT